MISANWNKAKLLITILDNRSTAMTGFQPHPGLDRNAVGDPTNPVSIEDIVKASNIDFVRTLDPYNVEEGERIFTEALKHDKTAVVISKHECALIAQRKARKAGTTELPYAVNHEACIHCKICMTQFGCPAIYSENKKSNIDPILCIGCGVCEAVCPHGAIYQLEEEA